MLVKYVYLVDVWVISQ